VTTSFGSVRCRGDQRYAVRFFGVLVGLFCIGHAAFASRLQRSYDHSLPISLRFVFS